MNRIAFSGKIASGKTLTANYLVENYGYTRIRFAEPIYQIADTILKVYQDDNYAYSMFLTDIYNICGDLLDNPTDANTAYKRLTHDLYNDLEPIGKHIRLKDPIHRRMMQTIGTEIMRSIDPYIWINYIGKTVENIPDAKIVLDDLRFKDEYLALKYLGFYLVRLNISPDVQIKRLKLMYGTYTLGNLLHRSETELDAEKFDYLINSDLPKENVFRIVSNVINW